MQLGSSGRVIFLLAALLTTTCWVQAQEVAYFETLPDAEEKKLLKGFVTKKQITDDPDFGWYATQLKYVKPNAEVVNIIKAKAYDFQLIFFIGTWCHDTQQLLPRYFATLEAAGYPEHYITIIACDRQKTAPANLHRPLRIVNVPTVLVMKDGKEMGRIEEFGTTGMVDKELAEIISKL